MHLSRFHWHTNSDLQELHEIPHYHFFQADLMKKLLQKL